jgi:hypothetical protein
MILGFPIFTFGKHFSQIENITAICGPADLMHDNLNRKEILSNF